MEDILGEVGSQQETAIFLRAILICACIQKLSHMSVPVRCKKV